VANVQGTIFGLVMTLTFDLKISPVHSQVHQNRKFGEIPSSSL